MRLRRFSCVGFFVFIARNVNLSTCSAFLLSSETTMNTRSPPLALRLYAAAVAPDKSSITVGFVGCGTIASAIATGLAAETAAQSITVTRRSESKSAALANQFPDLVTVVDENQKVLDAADIIFLTVLPTQTSAVLQSLQFDANKHTLVSLVSTSQLEQLAADSRLPAAQIYKMICLPAVASRQGVCLLQHGYHGKAHNDETCLLQKLLESLGGVVVADNDRQMSAMMVVTGLMGSFYGVLCNNRDWLMTHAGLSKTEAEFLVTRIYYGMIQDAQHDDNDDEGSILDNLIAEQTPAGLNEQGLANLQSLGVMDAYDKVQDAIFRRILGESDGSL